MKDRKHGKKEDNGIRNVTPVFPEPAPPLSKFQHIANGVAIVVALIILIIIAINVNNWIKTTEIEQNGSDASIGSDKADYSESTTEISEKIISNKTILGDPLAVSPVSLSRGKSIVVGIDDAVEIINPIYSSSDGEKDLVSLIFEPLIKLNDNYQPMPVLASSWLFDQSAKTLTFTLKPGHFFRDGRAVDINDVIFTYNCLISGSYNGPYKGRFSDIISIEKGEKDDSVIFQFNQSVTDPDFALFTVGILKSDYYDYSSDNVFEMYNDKKAPEGSGAFELKEYSEDEVVINLRQGYAGVIEEITFQKIALEDKYDLLKAGKLDIVRNQWNERMYIRSESLKQYTFYPSASKIESYALTGRGDQAKVLNSTEKRAAFLRAIAKLDLSQSEVNLLNSLDDTIEWYYFKGVNDTVEQYNLSTITDLSAELERFNIKIQPVAVDWPEMAAMAESGNFDLMLLPAPSDNRLPQGTILLTDNYSGSSQINAWPARKESEAIIINARILQISIAQNGYPLSASTASWTDRLENIRFYDPSENEERPEFYEEE